MNATEVFSTLKMSIDEACKAENYSNVLQVAEQLGMQGGENKESFLALRYEYEFMDDSGGSVELSFRSYDPSGPFQMEPDINRFSLSLKDHGKQVDQYSNSYSD